MAIRKDAHSEELDFGDMVYRTLFPLLILACAAAGVASFAAENHPLALDCFIAIFVGIRLDNHIQMRRDAEREEAAAQGWQRLRGPVVAS